MIVLPIVLASVSYDNLILSVGNLVGQGELLRTLSVLRFLLHDIVIPSFIIIGVELAHRAGANWANREKRFLSWIVACSLAGVNVVNNFSELDLIPTYFMGNIRYVMASVNGPPTITILVNLFILLIGLGLWVRLKWGWLFLGSLIALIGNAIPSAIVGTIPGSISEFVLALCLILTEQRTQFAINQHSPENVSSTADSLLPNS